MHALSGASREFEYRSPVRKIQKLVYFLKEEKRAENSSGKAHWCAKNKRTFRRTFGIGTTEVQLLDCRGPWHGRQHLEGLLAVNLLASADAEL